MADAGNKTGAVDEGAAAARVWTAASAGFEAARHFDPSPRAPRGRGLHGHGFKVCVFASGAESAYPGGEVVMLRQRLREAVAPLDYAHLNQWIDTPDDLSLARWIGARPGLAGAARIALRSTDAQGVDIDAGGRAQIWRRYAFQAAHWLPRVPAGHKCGRMHGHGFEVVIHAWAQAGVDAAALDAAWEPLRGTLDFHCLNDLEGLENPTSEMLAAWLWRRLHAALPACASVTVFETGSAGSNFDGHAWRIWKDFSFDSAVRLDHAPADAPESRLHGHTFDLRLQLRAPLDEVQGWILDYGDVKTLFEPVFKALDHRPLHAMDGLSGADTGSLAAWIMRATSPALPQLARVDLMETPGCGSVVGVESDVTTLPVLD